MKLFSLISNRSGDEQTREKSHRPFCEPARGARTFLSARSGFQELADKNVRAPARCGHNATTHDSEILKPFREPPVGCCGSRQHGFVPGKKRILGLMATCLAVCLVFAFALCGNSAAESSPNPSGNSDDLLELLDGSTLHGRLGSIDSSKGLRWKIGRASCRERV